MHFRPILSALLRNRTTLILLSLQIALTLAIICNSLHVVTQRFELVRRPSGLNEEDTFSVSSSGFEPSFQLKPTIEADMTLIRQLPGVVAATPINSLPLSGGGWRSGIQTRPDQVKELANAAFYFVDEQAIATLGTHIVGGRNFSTEEIGWRTPNDHDQPSGIIVTAALAEKIFPGESAVGKQVYIDDPRTTPMVTIMGIVDKLEAPWIDSSEVEFSVLVPQRLIYGSTSRYLIRTEPGLRNEIMKVVEAELSKSNRGRLILDARTFETVRADAYADDRAMMIVLGSIALILLMITGFGIVGTASFWVTQRTKQIGTRRALGATKGEILYYFAAENFIITSSGLVIGAFFTYAVSWWLVAHYHVTFLPPQYLLLGFACLWILGQAAVLLPALRASQVSPAVATSSV